MPESHRDISKFKAVLVGRDGEVLSAFDEALSDVRCECQLVPQGSFALDLIAGIGGVDLVVVSHPLPDMELNAFLAGLRSGKARGASTPVAVLTDKPLALESLSDSKCQVYRLDEPVPELVRTLTGRVERAQRAAAKLLVRLSLEKEGQELLRLTQSENVSRTGMLLRTKEDFPENARTAFEFSVPGEERPIGGEARIVRKVDDESAVLSGIAIHFESFRRADLPRFENFLEQLLPPAGRHEYSVGA